MTGPAKRTKTMRQRGLRELRLVVPDARSPAVRRRVAKQVAKLDRDHELDALKWIESVSEYDGDSTA
jgi:Antitoxin MazE-like